jgi:hypothetical protein
MNASSNVFWQKELASLGNRINADDLDAWRGSERVRAESRTAYYSYAFIMKFVHIGKD